jgi:peptide/nickel transport system permease protein
MKILNVVLRRFLTLIPMLLGISLLVFLLMTLAPGDFLAEAKASRDVSKELLERMQHDFGLDQPWYVQYLLWLKNILTLNFGESWIYKIPVGDLLMQRLPATIILSLTSLVFAWVIAIPLGVMAAVYKDSIFDRLSAILAYFALSIPEFFLALLAIFFAAQTGWFPIGGRTSIDYEFLSPGAQFLDYCHHLMLPTLVLGIGSIAGMMRIMRANFLDEIRAEYVTTARAKGLPPGVVMFRHVLKNAINPFVSSLGFAFSGLLSGALLVENVMNYPGLGQLIYQSFIKQDQYVVMAGVVIGSVMLMLGNLMADLLLSWTDPRIRLEEGGK